MPNQADLFVFSFVFAEINLSLEKLTAILGWTSVINLCLLVFSTVMLLGLRQPIKAFHSKLSGLSHEQLDQAYFQYLAQFKILFLVFNLAPYLAIRLFVL